MSENNEIFAIDNLSTGSRKNIDDFLNNENFHFIEGDILDRDKTEELINRVDLVYHLAAAVGVKTIIDKPLESFNINLMGTEIVLNIAQKKGVPVIFTSSSEVYGKNDELPFKEEHDRVYGSAFDNRWGYAFSKGAGEFLALSYFREKRLPVIVIRLFNVIGPKQSSAYGMVVPRFVKQALSNQPVTIYGSGNQTRCFINVKDVVSALVRLSDCRDAYGKILNLGSEEEIKISDLACMIKEMVKSGSEIINLPYEKVYGPGFADMMHRRADISKIRNLLNYEPQMRLEGSLQEIIDYFLKQQS